MQIRMDKDEVVYIDNPKENDMFVVFPTLNRKWVVESRRFGHIKTFTSQLMACHYCREQITK